MWGWSGIKGIIMVDGVSRQASKTASRLSTLIVSQAWLDGKKVINSMPLCATSSPDWKTAKFPAFILIFIAL